MKDHCLEVMRRSVLCNPDLTPYEIFWKDSRKTGMTLRAGAQRKCIDFNAIKNFAKSRTFSRDEILD